MTLASPSFRIRTVVETDSTNSDVLTYADQGETEGFWLRADVQTAGRGRMGRGWVSPPGNLYTSTLVRLGVGDAAAATLGFVAALALHDAAYATVPDIAFQLKWPNDVMAGGAKLSGILLERAGDAVVIGIGVNLASHPDLPDRKTTSLAALNGAAPEPGAFLLTLATAFEGRVAQWRGDGVSAILAAWRAVAHPVGTALKVSLPGGGALSGLYDGLSDDGALRLRLADGNIRVIHAGDVFLV